MRCQTEKDPEGYIFTSEVAQKCKYTPTIGKGISQAYYRQQQQATERKSMGFFAHAFPILKIDVCSMQFQYLSMTRRCSVV